MKLLFNSLTNKTQHVIGNCKCIVFKELKLNKGNFFKLKFKIIYFINDTETKEISFGLKKDINSIIRNNKHIIKTKNEFMTIPTPLNIGKTTLVCVNNDIYNFKLIIEIV